MKKHVIIPGIKYNRITPIEDLGVLKNNTIWLCRCDCGITRKFKASSLIRGTTKSCGCLVVELSKERMLKSRPVRNYVKRSSKSLFAHYKKTASSRNLEFSITLDEFDNLIVKNCYYCNKSPDKLLCRRDLKSTPIMKYNGIDRVDNSKGYILENCATCCYQCNFAKHTLSKYEFLKMIKDIYEHLIKPNQEIK